MKLEDIQKKNIYKVPDDYFDKLPGIIQSKVQKEKLEYTSWWQVLRRPAFAYAIPAMVVILTAAYVFLIRPDNTLQQEDILASVSTEDLIAYVEMSDMTTDEILEEIDIESVNVDDLFLEEIHLISDDDLTNEQVQEYLLELETNDLLFQ
ncbi:MAG TPA: hypothetical protein DDY13_04420 [Cytophagales bacterium]|jgi:hypothetical protein|nr:hypothetical protein [Cytophagales bacterium]